MYYNHKKSNKMDIVKRDLERAGVMETTQREGRTNLASTPQGTKEKKSNEMSLKKL